MRTKHEGAAGPKPGRLYYGQRAGLDAPQLEFAKLRSLIAATFSALDDAGWFQEWFGYWCVDNDFVPGKAGEDRDGFIHTRTWMPGLWPIREKLSTLDETALFTIVELLHDCVSKPIDGYHHSYGGCGMHWSEFDGVAGQARWRDEVNGVLQFYGEGFELSPEGEVQRRGAHGARELMAQQLPRATPDTDREKVDIAVRAYRHFNAKRQQKVDAVRSLVDVLEYYRRDVVKKRELSADENDLFTIANKFAIRHHRDDQRSNYSDEFLDWLFHLYLATAHLTLRLAHGADEPSPQVPNLPGPPEGYREEDYGDADIPF